MNLTNPIGAASRRRLFAMTIAAGASVLAMQPAAAQAQATPGPYGVVRAGVQLDSDLRLGNPIRPVVTTRPGTPTPTPTASPLARSIDANAGFTGELGAGYDFGGFRLEGTIGYGSAGINEDALGDRTNVGDGRLKSLDLGVSGYLDFNHNGAFKPFVGGGIGASRIDADVSRIVRPTTTTPTTPTTPATPVATRPGTRIDQSDWGFRWHLDAGVGYEVSPGTTLELAGRYSRVTSLDLTAATRTGTGTTATTTRTAFEPRQSSTSLMLGLRQKF